jgi:hypothetical protein
VSIAGITSTNFNHLADVQSNFQKIQSEFKQLGQDLRAGDLTQAQADFLTLSQSLASPPNFVGPAAVGQQSSSSGAFAGAPPNFVRPNAVGRAPQANSVSSSHHRIHFRQALSHLGQALQPGNLSAAQQAFATMAEIWQTFGGAVRSGAAVLTGPVNLNA